MGLDTQHPDRRASLERQPASTLAAMFCGVSMNWWRSRQSAELEPMPLLLMSCGGGSGRRAGGSDSVQETALAGGSAADAASPVCRQVARRRTCVGSAALRSLRRPTAPVTSDASTCARRWTRARSASAPSPVWITCVST